MKKIIFMILIFSGLSSFSFAAGITIEPGVLMIGMDMDYPPMCYLGPDGTPMGFDVEVGKAIAQRLGLRAEFVYTAWEEIFYGLETRRYDAIISAVTITPTRKPLNNFSEPYLANSLVMVLPKGSPIAARSPRETAGLNVAVQAYTWANSFMEDLADEGVRHNLLRYDQLDRCFTELELGRVDVVIADIIHAAYYVAQENSPFEIVWQGQPYEYFGICIRNGNDALTEAVNNVLEELFNDGTMLNISHKIFGMDIVTR